MSEQFTISTLETEGRASLLNIGGRLDAPAAVTLRQRCSQLWEEGHRNIALDMSAVSFVASSGVGVLLALTEELGKQGGNLYLAPVSPAVLSVIRLLNLEQFLAIHETREAAISVII
jgi:anti-sigma B factor antagonist